MSPGRARSTSGSPVARVLTRWPDRTFGPTRCSVAGAGVWPPARPRQPQECSRDEVRRGACQEGSSDARIDADGDGSGRLTEGGRAFWRLRCRNPAPAAQDLQGLDDGRGARLRQAGSRSRRGDPPHAHVRARRFLWLRPEGRGRGHRGARDGPCSLRGARACGLDGARTIASDGRHGHPPGGWVESRGRRIASSPASSSGAPWRRSTAL